MAIETKFEYEAPTLTEIGSFEEITQATGALHHNDILLPTGTAFDPANFS